MTTRSAASKRKADWIAPSFDAIQELSMQNNKPHKVNHNPWIEKHRPHFQDDLAVHKKKIQEVKSWIEQHLENNNKTVSSNILLVTGPSGCGKSATIHMLKNVLTYDLKEWINPLTQEYDPDRKTDHTARQESQSQLFHDFLFRTNRYERLTLFDTDVDKNLSKAVILVEDMPNFLLYDSDKMHSLLRQYTKTGRSPLVFLMSNLSSMDNFVNALFPKHLQNELRITNISFNAIAFTSLLKVMNKIIDRESKENELMNVPSRDALELIATSSNGDIRSCINSLQFYCTGDAQKCSISRKKQKGKNVIGVTKPHGCIGEKDTSLFLFRALGKILYSKRDIETESNQLPQHLKCYVRKRLLVDPEDVYEHTQVSSEHFLLHLHENFTEFFSNIDDLSLAEDYCCEADVLSSFWSTRNIMSDYSASLSMRGIMFASNTSNTSNTHGGWRPLHKPQWYQANKTLISRERFTRDIFKVTRYSRKTLFTEVLPHVGMYTNSNCLLQDIAHFSNLPARKCPSNKGDVEMETISSNPIEDWYGGDDNDEDYIIEDFDD